jgi:Fe2+ or Zn2+ uptake regulation protein
MPRTTASIVAALLERNVRVTAPRSEIIDCISRVPRTFTAEAICSELPHIGRATVYRTLKILQDADIVCKVVMPGDEMVYSVSADLNREPGAARNPSHHHHAVCTVCNAVRYFNAEVIERAVRALSRSVEGVMGEIIDHRIEVYDVCPRCIATDTA